MSSAFAIFPANIRSPLLISMTFQIFCPSSIQATTQPPCGRVRMRATVAFPRWRTILCCTVTASASCKDVSYLSIVAVPPVESFKSSAWVFGPRPTK
eukprot:XP_001706603.1 Hypothetical protein GL50803_31684 [Giardia lamblia ATCC 50803]